MIELSPPIKGISKGLPTDKEQPMSSGYCSNVRPVDVMERQLRIGQRPGLSLWGTGTLIGAENQPVIAFCVVASVN